MQMSLSSRVPAQFVVAKRLVKSDLGWFAEPRFLGRAGEAKQRAIAFNATLVHEILYPGEQETGVSIPVRRQCRLAEDRPRPLSRSGKNWRLGGDKVEGEYLGLTEEEIAFYDALAENESAVQVLGSPTLKVIAQELVSSLKKNVTVDWAVRQQARARLRMLVRKILKRFGYPPDLQDDAVKLVLQQAESLTAQWHEVV